LESLLKQQFEEAFEVIVTDNDYLRSGEKVVEQAKAVFQAKEIPLTYLVEPIQNISLARNRGIRAARGKYIAFIDDDERASSHWLTNLYKTIVETEADGVWGPVIPDIPNTFPEWMRRSQLFQRPTQKDKSVMTEGMRTGNALLKRALLGMREGPFAEEFGRTGGEDSDLFLWLLKQGFKFVWAARAEVTEQLEEHRRYLRWHLRRAYRGGWGYSRLLVNRHGRGIGMLLSFLRIIPSSFKAIFFAISNLNNPRYSGLVLLSNISTNLGKLGYFIGLKVEEYKQ